MNAEIDEAAAPRNTWLPTAAVVERFGFDPAGHDEPGHARPIRSKLDAGLRRVWLLADVEAVAAQLQGRR